jgi:hypothetical protein
VKKKAADSFQAAPRGSVAGCGAPLGVGDALRSDATRQRIDGGTRRCRVVASGAAEVMGMMGEGKTVEEFSSQPTREVKAVGR